jgi:mRNA interferase HigB
MRVVGTDKLLEFANKHPPARSWTRAWLAEARDAKWQNSQDIKGKYPSASFLAGNRVIFNVKGNDYRMVADVAYRAGVLVVKWIGTHAQYSRINWEDVKNETRSG